LTHARIANSATFSQRLKGDPGTLDQRHRSQQRRDRDADPRGPRLHRALNRLSVPTARLASAASQARLARAQRPGGYLLTPIGATDDGFASLVDAGPPYMGQTIARIDEIRSAAEIVVALTP
jgi:hypothetical protein